MSSHLVLSAALATAICATAVEGRAQGAGSPNDSLATCAKAYEQSQEHQQAGELSAARAVLAVCKQPVCPQFIRSDCARWSIEVDAAQPSVVFFARRGTQALTEVSVSCGNRILAKRLEGQVLELDPAEYDFRFETLGSEPVVQHAVVRAGEKRHPVEVEFAPLTAGRTVTSSAPDPNAIETEQPAGSAALPWTLVALGAASMGAGVGFAAWGHSTERGLRDSCAPDCSDASVGQLRTRYLLADISFGVGLGSLAAAAYMFVRDRDSNRVTSGALPLKLVAGPNGILAGYGSRF